MSSSVSNPAGAAGGGLYQRLAAVVGAAQVLRTAQDMAPYCSDLLGAHHGRPHCVVRPGSTAEAAAVVAACAAAGAPVVACGGNTGFCGGSIPDDSGTQVVVALSRMNRIRAIDTVGDSIAVDAGCVLAQVREHAAAHGRLLPLSHGGEGTSQIGGNLATNAGGLNVLRYGMARELVLGLEVVLADGRVLDMMRALRKDNTGYDLKQLFIGSEGTLGLITGAVLKLFPLPARRETALAAVADPGKAVELLAHARAALGARIAAFELVPRSGMALYLEFDRGAADPFDAPHPWYVLIELEGEGLAAALEAALRSGLVSDAIIAQSEAQRASLWRVREGLAMAQVADPSNLKNDTAVPIAAIDAFIARASLAAERAVPGVRPIPFGHVGDGNIHFNLSRPPDMAPARFIERWPDLVAAIEAVALALGGSISAEHGIGRAKRAALQSARPAVELEMMRTVKRALDPHGLMNPGKVL
jgi:FAD/FMN-containing dehydrogenase